MSKRSENFKKNNKMKKIHEDVLINDNNQMTDKDIVFQLSFLLGLSRKELINFLNKFVNGDAFKSFIMVQKEEFRNFENSIKDQSNEKNNCDTFKDEYDKLKRKYDKIVKDYDDLKKQYIGGPYNDEVKTDKSKQYIGGPKHDGYEETFMGHPLRGFVYQPDDFLDFHSKMIENFLNEIEKSFK